MTQNFNSWLKNNKFLYTIYIIDNIDIDEVEDIFDKYINNHNQKFLFYYIDFQFQINFKNNTFAQTEINQHFNTDYINIKNYLLFYIDSCRYGNFIFDNIIKIEISMISCRCNMTYKNYINSPMSLLERYINKIFVKNPSLKKSLNIRENHSFIKYFNYLLLNKRIYQTLLILLTIIIIIQTMKMIVILR